jgi:hypothetical protein
MRIIISDTSCLIDLRKAALLTAFLRLPLKNRIPNTLFADELLSFSAEEKKNLIAAGLKVVDLPGPQVSRAREVMLAQPRLSIHDGFAFALAETHTGCILLTGDSALRALAERRRIEVHGSSGSVTNSLRASSQRPDSYMQPSRYSPRIFRFDFRSANWLPTSGATKV